MKQNLSDDYEICVANMVPLTKEQASKGFEVVNSEFIDFSDDDFNKVNMDILVREETSEQIFYMKDGRYVLEVEADHMVEYFYSTNIEDLL